MIKSVAFTISLAFLFLSVFAAKADIYRQNTNELIFTYQDEVTAYSDSTVIRHLYYTPEGELAAIDEAVIQDKTLIRGKTRLLQVDETGESFLNKDNILLRFNRKGDVKQKDFSIDKEILVGPLFDTFVQRNWKALIDGTDLRFLLPAPDVMMIGNFSLKKVESDYTTAEKVVFRLSPVSIFLKIFISPSYFVYDLRTRELTEIHGTTILPTLNKGKWSKTTDADIFFRK
ncbi:MAG: hypothetical protein JXR56_01045 [Candidatus Cloacimonetes bacterium]|nr:hypothetical protein [Candidatus Cloacimonadota bacterium]